MRDIKTSIDWKWLAILLLLCNVALLVTIWVKPSQEKEGREERPREYVIRNLKLTDEQVKQYDVLISEHQQAMRQLRRSAMKARQQLFSNLKNDDQKSINTDSLTQIIAITQKQVELATYDHFRKFRTILTDAQKAEFDKIINDVLKKMNGGPPPHDNPQGRPPGPEEDGPPPQDGQEPPPPDGAEHP